MSSRTGSREGSPSDNSSYGIVDRAGSLCTDAGHYVGHMIFFPRMRMALDNQYYLGRMWQVMWIVGLVVAALCLNAHLNSNIHFTPTEYLKDLFNNCEVFKAMCYVSLGALVGYILFGQSDWVKNWFIKERSLLQAALPPEDSAETPEQASMRQATEASRQQALAQGTAF